MISPDSITGCRALKGDKEEPHARVLLPHVLRDLLADIAHERKCPDLLESAFAKQLAVCQAHALHTLPLLASCTQSSVAHAMCHARPCCPCLIGFACKSRSANQAQVGIVRTKTV